MIILQGLGDGAIFTQGYEPGPGTVVVAPAAPAPLFFPETSNLVGTYAIIPDKVAVGNHSMLPEVDKPSRGLRFVEIEFTYGGTKYRKAFYTEQTVDVLLDGIQSKPGRRQNVLLEGFKGTIAWKK